MNSLFRLLASVAVLIFTTSASAQLPGRGQMGPGGFNNGGGALSPVDRLMSMDANGDGQLTVNEVTDVRMRTVLNRADANQDGMVSRAELTVMAGGQAGGGNRGGVQGAAGPQGFGGNQAFGGNQGFGGQPGFGGPPAGGMPGGPGQQAVGHAPQPVGQILPSAMHDQLGLNADQRRAIAKLQKEVDAQLTKILSPEQQQQLQQLGAGGTGGPQEAGQARARGRAQARGQERVQEPGQATGPDQGRGGRVPAEQ